MSTDDLIRTLADHVAALATRVERGTFQTTRIANASEESNALVLTEAREARTAHVATVIALENISKQLAVLVDNIKDGEKKADDTRLAAIETKHSIENLSGSFPRVELDTSESEKTDRTIGKVVRGVVSHRVLPWLATAGLAIWHVVEKLFSHGGR
jgi:hypothetical protein